MLEIILILIFIGLFVKFIKFAFPFLILAGIIYLCYLYPLYVIPVFILLVAIGIYTQRAEKKQEEMLLKIIIEKGIADINSLYEILPEENITKDKLNEYLSNLKNKGDIEIIDIKTEKLVKSTKYKTNTISLEVD